MKLLNLMFLPLVTTPVSLIVANNNENPTFSVIRNKNLQERERATTDKWVQSIKESSDNPNTVKLFFNRHAALAYQTEMLVLGYMYNAKNRTNNDDLLWFFNDANLNDYNNQYLVDNYEKNNTNDEYTFKLVNDASKLDSNYDSSIKYAQYPDDKMIGYLLQKYSNTNTMFDLWIVDASLSDMWNLNANINSKNFYNFFKRINKVYVLSDGNLQTNSFVYWVLDRINRTGYKQFNDANIKNGLDKIKADVNDVLLEKFYTYSIWDMIHYKEMFTVFHTQEYTNSSYYKLNNGVKLYDTYPINYNYYQMGEMLFPNDKDELNKFNSDYEQFFNLTNLNNLNNFFWKNFENYDPNKKNLIWMGDSLVNNEKYWFKEKETEMKYILKSYMNKFPKSEYNYIVKFHPFYDEKKQTSYMNWLLGDDSLWIHFKQVPWELFLSWDYKKQMTDENYIPFFSSTSNDNVAKSKLIGFQYTTTVVQTTAFFLESVYNLPLDKVEKTVDSSDFCIPVTFDCVKRDEMFNVNINETIEKNKMSFSKIYDPFVLNNTYPSYSKKLVTATEYINKNYDPSYNPLEVLSKPTNNDNNDLTPLWISIGIILPLLAVSTVVTIVVLKKRKNNKI